MNQVAASPQRIVLPRALRAGDHVRLVSPASWIDLGKVEAGMMRLRQLGYQPELSRYALARHGQYSAGAAAERIEDLHAAFEDDSVSAIICNRGGYGSAELLTGLDIARIRHNPKVFVGCSDISTLQTWLHDTTGLVVFHGPMAAGDFARANGVDEASWDAAVGQARPWTLGPESGLRSLKTGKATGKFYGGCLSMLAASLGTPFEIQTDRTILFLEDVGTKPYQIDRMLMQLRLAGKLDGVRGIIFGQMKDCVQPAAPADLLDAVITRALADFAGPIAIGLRSGHVSERNITLPIGIQCELELTITPTLQFPGPAVTEPAVTRS